jgi:AraC-like DNA-binding protein
MMDSELEYIEHIKEAPLRLLIVSLDSSSAHWHQEYEVVFVLSGDLNFCEEEKSCQLQKGDLLLINPLQVHSFRKRANDNICLILQFSPTVITEVYDRLCSFQLNTANDQCLPPESLVSMQRCLADMGLLLHFRPDGYQFGIKSGLYMFVSLMFRHLKYSAEQESLPQAEDCLRDFDLIKQYIKERFRESVDQAQIGRALGMSRAKVYRVLRSAGSESTKGLTNFYRVEHAKHLLKNTGSSIGFIAAESGFDSDSSFYRVFREVTGITPQEFRKSPLKKMESAGIQGYSMYSVSSSVSLLKEYSSGRVFD